MGSLPGHLLPGAFFVVFSVWWMVHMCRRFSKRRNEAFVSSLTFNLPLACGGINPIPLEASVKIIFGVIGALAEFFWSLKYDYGVPIGNMQHITMYSCFALSGAVDILVQFKGDIYPLNIDYMALVLALTGEAVLLEFHLHGRSKLDVSIHTLLVYVIVMSVVALMIEMKYKQSFISALSRAYFFLLQGTWFCQVGLILHGPTRGRWKSNDQDHIMFAVVMFVWHAAFDFVFVLFVCWIVAFLSRKMKPRNYASLSSNDDRKTSTYEMGFSDDSSEDNEI